MININCEQNIDRNGRLENIINLIENKLSQYGYMGLDLPIYDYYELLKDTVFNFSDESIIRFVDRSTGKTLVLRPDFTPQVCRFVAGIDNILLPFRVSYKGPVFRSVEKDRGIKSEEYQIGYELFGESGLSGDMEIVLIADDCLKTAGIKEHIFTFGDSVFLNRIKELGGSLGEKLLDAITFKRLHEIKSIIDNKECLFNNDFKNLLIKLPLLFGSIDIIDELKKLSKFDSVLFERISYVESLFNLLIKNGISKESLIFDGAESKGLDYYTGINFEILHHDCGSILGGGGRYDNLMSKFNRNTASCGVALNIDNLLNFSICKSSVCQFDYLVTGEENFQKSMELRNQGLRVLYLKDKSKKDEFIKNYTFKNII